MAVNQLDCLTMDCTSPVENTEIANDQKYSQMWNKRSQSVRKVVIFAIVFFNEDNHKNNVLFQ